MAQLMAFTGPGTPRPEGGAVHLEEHHVATCQVWLVSWHKLCSLLPDIRANYPWYQTAHTSAVSYQTIKLPLIPERSNHCYYQLLMHVTRAAKLPLWRLPDIEAKLPRFVTPRLPRGGGRLLENVWCNCDWFSTFIVWKFAFLKTANLYVSS